MTAGTSVPDAARVMRDYHVGALLVTGPSGELHGIVTDRDICLRAVASGSPPGQLTLADIASSPLVVVDLEATPQEAISMMQEHHVRRLIVADGGSPIGLVTREDLTEALSQSTLDLVI